MLSTYLLAVLEYIFLTDLVFEQPVAVFAGVYLAGFEGSQLGMLTLISPPEPILSRRLRALRRLYNLISPIPSMVTCLTATASG